MKRMSTLLTIVALTACCAPVFSATAQTVSHTSGKPKSAEGHSATIDPALIGAWTPSIADCSRLFERASRGLSFKQPVDKFAQAAIIRPGEIEGPSSVCRLLKVTRAKDTISAATECRDTVGYLSLNITIKVQSARQIIYSPTGGETLNETYLKCQICSGAA